MMINISKSRKSKDLLFKAFLYLSAAIVLLPLILIFSFLLQKGSSSLNLDFFLNGPKPVGEIGGGMAHAIQGTLFMVLMASVWAIPIGTLCGVYLSEYGKGKIANSLKFTIDLLTGVPSIVIGIFSYLILVVPLKSFSALAGSFALSIIIIPIITKTTEEILKLIPRHIKEAGLALGLPRWKVIYHIVLKGSRSQLMTGTMLAISRASGETAPLLFTAFGNMYFSYNLKGPMASLPVQIYNYAISPYEDWQNQAWAGAFTLILLVLGLNIGARVLFKKPKFMKFRRKRS